MTRAEDEGPRVRVEPAIRTGLRVRLLDEALSPRGGRGVAKRIDMALKNHGTGDDLLIAAAMIVAHTMRAMRGGLTPEPSRIVLAAAIGGAVADLAQAMVARTDGVPAAEIEAELPVIPG